MFKEVKARVFEANLSLKNNNLIILTWGNVSERYGDFVAIKPSGVSYDKLKPENMVVLDLDGNIIEGNYKPSSDTPTHLELYKAYPKIKGICHTHSTYATSFAQAGADIKCFGTTHADYFYESVQCTRELTKEEVENEYEKNTGKVIIEALNKETVVSTPAILVKNHGVFTWGKNAAQAVENALVLEEIAKINHLTLAIEPNKQEISKFILDKHYSRKHGKDAYYGQC